MWFMVPFLYPPKHPVLFGALLQAYSVLSMTTGGLALCSAGAAADAVKTLPFRETPLPTFYSAGSLWLVDQGSHITKAHMALSVSPNSRDVFPARVLSFHLEIIIGSLTDWVSHVVMVDSNTIHSLERAILRLLMCGLGSRLPVWHCMGRSS